MPVPAANRLLLKDDHRPSSERAVVQLLVRLRGIVNRKSFHGDVDLAPTGQLDHLEELLPVAPVADADVGLVRRDEVADRGVGAAHADAEDPEIAADPDELLSYVDARLEAGEVEDALGA